MRQFFIILLVILLIQLPNLYFILGRDSGGIDDFGNENSIIVSDLVSIIFSFPIYFFVHDKIDNYALGFMIYIVDLILISVIIHLTMNELRKLMRRYTRENLPPADNA